jgi:hypothetical protein
VQQAARAHGGTATAQNAAGGGALVEVSFGRAMSTREPGPTAPAATHG